MSRGNRIVVTPGRGWPVEGVINAGETPKPGQIVQIDPTQAMQGGRFVWKLYTTGTDGKRPKGPFIVLTEDVYQGRTVNDAYAAGERCFGFVPLAGCELNLLYKNVAGTADDVVAGNLFAVDDATGKVQVSAGTEQTEVAMAMEALTDPTADALVWSIWTGY
jgi:hypothetical protein